MTIRSVEAVRGSPAPSAAGLLPIAASPALNAATPTLGNTENSVSLPVSSSIQATAPCGPGEGRAVSGSPDYDGEVDHAALIARPADYDG